MLHTTMDAGGGGGGGAALISLQWMQGALTCPSVRASSPAEDGTKLYNDLITVWPVDTVCMCGVYMYRCMCVVHVCIKVKVHFCNHTHDSPLRRRRGNSPSYLVYAPATNIKTKISINTTHIQDPLMS